MNPLQALARFARATPSAPPTPTPSCELCRAPLEEQHKHLLDNQSQEMCCACRACALLFDTPAPGARYRTVGGRVRVDPELRLDEALWTRLQIPVRLAFFASDPQGIWTASYPGAAGATRAPVDPASWASLADSRLVRALAPETEALLVWSRRIGEPFECFAVPIDRCYALVGILRRNWRGFSGGDVWRQVERFFVELRAQAVPL